MEDWKQLQQAALSLRAKLSEVAGELGEDLDLSLEHTLGRPTRLVEQAADKDELSRVLEDMGIRKPDQVVMYSGGAVFMEGGVDLNVFKNQQIEYLMSLIDKGQHVLIVTGGTNSGFMQIAGEIAQVVRDRAGDHRDQLQVLGVSPKALVTFDATKADGNGPYEAAVGHTHHILVDSRATSPGGESVDLSDKFGDETNTIREICDLYGSQGAKKDAIVGNGGVGTALEIRALIDVGYPVLLVKDSYRMATLVGTALEATTYEQYKQLLEQRLVVADGEPESLSKQKKRTQGEKDNIFSLLRATDADTDTSISKDLKKVPVVSEKNYQKVRELLLGAKNGVRLVSADELRDAM
jgi:hypothetical protein